MPKIETRTNPENGKTEYFINYPVENLQSLEKLINTINSREDETTPIFITEPITLEYTTIPFVITIYNCIFENKITIQNCIFNGEFNFINNISEKSINLKDNIFDNIEFSNSTFKYNIQIINNTFKGDFNLFIATKFEDIANFNHCKFLGKTLNFTNAIFNGQTDFQNTEFAENTYSRFEGTKFNDKCHFMGSKFHGTTRFSCNFNDNVIFGLSTEDDKKKTEFFGKTSFAGTTFEKKVRFLSCIFHQHTSFNNTTFNDLVDFYGAIFKSPQQFSKTDFNSVAVFNYTVFEKEAQFIYCSNKPSSYINFQSSIFKKGLDISRSNFTCSMAFWGIQIDDNGILKAFSSQQYEEDFNTEDPENNNDPKDSVKTAQKLRESIRYIKNNFLSENNKIEALNFYKKEMEIYRKEISISKSKNSENKNTSEKEILHIATGIYIPLIIYLFNYENKALYWTFIFFVALSILLFFTIKYKNIIQYFKTNIIISLTALSFFIISIFSFSHYLYYYTGNFNSFLKLNFTSIFLYFFIFIFLFNSAKDNILLFFNKISNDFGTNWVQGVCFTIIMAGITFIVMAAVSGYTISLSENALQNSFISFLKIINILDLKPFDDKNKDSLFGNINSLTLLFLFIGRIFIGYGYYQTIQAFRKYGKS